MRIIITAAATFTLERASFKLEPIFNQSDFNLVLAVARRLHSKAFTIASP